MNVLVAHNKYKQPGGEDEVVAAEIDLLRSYGHRVLTYRENNERIDEMSRARAASITIWSGDSYARIRRIIRDENIDVVHVHNFFPLISPSIYYAAVAEGAAVVQTLHNYRLLCCNAIFFRNGKICEDCLGKSVPLNGVRNACYRGSRSASAAVTAMTAVHRAAGTWVRMVDVYIALSRFGRDKFIAGGLPAERIVVKPNFVDADAEAGYDDRSFAVFVGRLSEEKGIMTMLEAWRLKPGLPLYIAGDGPLFEKAAAFARFHRMDESVVLLGRIDREQVMALLKRARMLIFPSECYEAFGCVAIEAFSCGTPVISSDAGAMPEVVRDGVSGLLFPPGDSRALARAVSRLAADPEEAGRLGDGAREQFVSEYSAATNYSLLMEIYRKAVLLRNDKRHAFA